MSDRAPHENLVLAHITCADTAQARRIGRALVEQHLAACVHIYPHEAIYRWQGSIEQAPECTLLAKTTAACFGALQQTVLALHSYDLPAILAIPVAGGHAPFLAWVAAATRPSPDHPDS